VLDTTSAESPRPATTGTPVRRRRRRRPSVRAALVFTHRWSALVLGIALLLVVISGVVLLYEQEIDRVVHPELYRTTESANPISHAEAAAVVRRELPSAKAVDVVDSHGVYLVYIDDYERHAFVDPGSGRLLGVDDPRDG